MVMSRLASECSSACNKDALPDEPAKISPQRLSGFVRLGKYLNSIELGVGVDKLVPGGTNRFVELEDVRGFRRVALSNVLVVGQSRKDLYALRDNAHLARRQLDRAIAKIDPRNALFGQNWPTLMMLFFILSGPYRYVHG